jgi:hypothetical protein
VSVDIAGPEVLEHKLLDGAFGAEGGEIDHYGYTRQLRPDAMDFG